MNFVVTVMCVAHLTSCPLEKPMVNEFQAANRAECENKVAALIEYYGHKKAEFNINCKRKP